MIELFRELEQALPDLYGVAGARLKPLQWWGKLRQIGCRQGPDLAQGYARRDPLALSHHRLEQRLSRQPLVL